MTTQLISNVDRVDTRAEFALGMRFQTSDGKTYTYVQADAAIPSRSNLYLTGQYQVTAATNAQTFFGVAPDTDNIEGTDIDDGDYFWAQVAGLAEGVNCADAGVAGATLTYATDGNGDLVAGLTPRGHQVTATASGVATVILY